MRHTHMIILALIFLLTTVGCEGLGTTSNDGMTNSDGGGAGSRGSGDGGHISATNLVKEYEANPVAWDAKYKGKNVIVSGEIREIQPVGRDDALVLLKAGNIEYVEVTFANLFKDELLELRTGQKVVLRCKGQRGSLDLFTVAYLTNCRKNP